jgi:hypothetical protein
MHDNRSVFLFYNDARRSDTAGLWDHQAYADAREKHHRIIQYQVFRRIQPITSESVNPQVLHMYPDDMFGAHFFCFVWCALHGIHTPHEEPHFRC